MVLQNRFVYNSKVEQIAAKARVASSNEELASLCRQLNVADRIFLGKVDLWFAKQALSAVYRTLKKFPALRRVINYFGTLNGFIKYKDDLFVTSTGARDEDVINEAKATLDDMAIKCRSLFQQEGLAVAFYCETGDGEVFGGIIINGKSLHQRAVLQDLAYCEQSGYHPQGCGTIKSVIDHELGHVIDFCLSVSSSARYKRFIKQFDMVTLGSQLSNYSVENNTVDHLEIVAEAYAEYCNNPTPRKIAAEIGKMIEDKYRRKYG